MIVGTSHRQVKKWFHRQQAQGVQCSECCVQIAQLGGNNAVQSALSDVSAKCQPTVACLSTVWTAGAV